MVCENTFAPRHKGRRQGTATTTLYIQCMFRYRIFFHLVLFVSTARKFVSRWKSFLIFIKTTCRLSRQPFSLEQQCVWWSRDGDGGNGFRMVGRGAKAEGGFPFTVCSSTERTRLSPLLRPSVRNYPSSDWIALENTPNMRGIIYNWKTYAHPDIALYMRKNTQINLSLL